MLVGNTLAERMQLFNHFETLLATRFPDLQPDGAEPGLERRHGGAAAAAAELRDHAHASVPPEGRRHPRVLRPQRVVRRRRPGCAQFEQDLTAYLRANLAAQYNGTSAPRLVLVSPIAHERLARLTRVDVDARNRELARYTEAMGRVARAAGRAVCRPVHADAGADGRGRLACLAEAGGGGLTINGIHLNEDGDRIVAQLLMAALGLRQRADGRRPTAEMRRLEALREAIRDKNQQFFYRWRPVNAEYVVGRRVEPFGSVNFPGEMKQLDEMVAARDRRIWQRAQALKGLGYPATCRRPAPGTGRPSDATRRTTRRCVAWWRGRPASAPAAVQGQRQEPNRGGQLDLSSADPRVALERLRPAPGYEVNLFASEEQFPDIAKPVAMTFDARGRLWVLTSPTYPHLAAGQDAGRQAGDSRRHQRRRPCRQVDRVCRRASTCRWGSSSATAACTCRRSRT